MHVGRIVTDIGIPATRRSGAAGEDDPGMTTEILIFDGFDDLDAFGPFEVLTGAGLDTRFVTIEPAERVTSAHGARGRAARRAGRSRPGDRARRRLERPGRARAPTTRPGAASSRRRCRAPRARAAGSARVCTGAMLLAEAGILAAAPRSRTTRAIEDLRGVGADVVEGAPLRRRRRHHHRRRRHVGHRHGAAPRRAGARRGAAPRRARTRSSGTSRSLDQRASASGRSIGTNE